MPRSYAPWSFILATLARQGVLVDMRVDNLNVWNQDRGKLPRANFAW